MPEEMIGLMGGSFDPIHHGHLIAAQDALEAAGLDRIIFIPAARSPLKDRSPVASDADRLALIRTALEGEDRFEVSTLELERGGVSYSVDTMDDLKNRYPGARLFWIVGADQAESLRHWHRVDALVQGLEFIVLARPGFAWDPNHLPIGARCHPVEAHTFSISSSEIRDRVREGKSIRFLVPEGVATAIEKRHLYG